MSDSNKNNDGKIIEGHNYDGIEELDHPLPKWWVYLFYATIVYGVCYYSYYELLGGPSHQEKYLAAMKKIEQRKTTAPQPEINKEIDVAALLADEGALKDGSVMFKQYCAACHGQNGEGVIGPNLTDNYWMYSKGKYEGIMKAIIEGFPEKGMPPWGEIVPKDKQPSLAAYVISLKGSNPANAKPAQGDLIE